MIDRQRRSLWRSVRTGAQRTITKSTRVIFNCAHKQQLPPKESPPLEVLRSGNSLITCYAAVSFTAMLRRQSRWFRLNLTGVSRILAWTSDENFHGARLVAAGALSRVADSHTRTRESSCGSSDLRTLVWRRLHDTYIRTRRHVFTRWSGYKRWGWHSWGESFSCFLLPKTLRTDFRETPIEYSNKFLPRSASLCGFVYLASLRNDRVL